MRRVLPLLIVLSLGFAPAPVPREDRTLDARKLEGTWVLTGAAVGVPADDLLIGPGHMEYGPAYKHHSYKFSLAEGKLPAKYDLIRNLSGEESTKVTILGILKLDGDVLTLSYNLADLGRPTAFEGRGKGDFNAVYKRKKL